MDLGNRLRGIAQKILLIAHKSKDEGISVELRTLSHDLMREADAHDNPAFVDQAGSSDKKRPR